jgi:hypothetical protein
MLTDKEIILLCLSELWDIANKPGAMSDYEEYRMARTLQFLQRRYVRREFTTQNQH